MDDLLPGLSQSLNVHPLFVHFPIALWSFAFLLWTLGQFLDRKDFLSAARWALYAGTLGGLLTVATGYLASNGLGRDSAGHDFVHVHRNFMLVATGIALVTTGLAFFLKDTVSQKACWLVCGALFLTVTVTTLGADRGALLVYTYGMGTQTAPEQSSDHGGSDHGGSDHGGSDHGGSDHGGSDHGGSDHHNSSDSKGSPTAGDHH